MSRILSPRCFAVLLSIVFAFCIADKAAAQVTINQTSCAPVGGSCTTVGFLESLTVNCNASEKINNALASLHDRSGPNRIVVSGTCSEFVNIVGFNRLTIEGAGATLTGSMSVSNSGGVTLKSLVFSAANPGAFNSTLLLAESHALLDGVTIQSPAAGGIAVTEGGQVDFFGAPSVINNTQGIGINVVKGTANVMNVTISNNRDQGVYAHEGGSLVFWNQFFGQETPVDVFGNGREGVYVEGGTLKTITPSSLNTIHIHDNHSVGLRVEGSPFAEVDGRVKIDGNHGDSQIEVAVATLILEGGVEVQGDVTAFINSVLAISSGAVPNTVTGTVNLFGSVVGYLEGANSIGSMSCDDTSWAISDSQSLISGSNTCPSNGPAGGVGPQGPQGPQGVQGPQGDPGVSAQQVVSSPSNVTVGKNALSTVTATCPAGKLVLGGGAKTSNPNLAIITNEPNGTSGWSVTVANTAGNAQSGLITATAICAVVQ